MRRLLLLAVLAVSAHAQTVVTIDAAAGRHRIDPRIYGVSSSTNLENRFSTTANIIRDLNTTFVRAGGNLMSRYNWEQNASNHAADWYFESLPDGPSSAPGAMVDELIENARGAGAGGAITIGMMGWVAKLGSNRTPLWSFSVRKYGGQQSTDPYAPDAGNGTRPDGSPITGNDPEDANLRVDASFYRGWVAHLQTLWGSAPVVYLLDNESSIWYATHRDVMPQGVGMDELLARMKTYAEAVKSIDPAATVAGPEEWGWLGYLLSGYDQQWANDHQNWSNTPDRIAHGGMDYLPWLLREMRRYELQHGKRLLDIFTVHYYPQGGDPAQTTRSLWDPGYTDPSWIQDRVRLIPRLHEWADAYAPGVAVGLTEYNWGDDNPTAQADVLGILGREDVQLATRWTTPEAGTPVYRAMQMYRNYDGARSAFGDVSVRASVPNPDTVAAFAAIRSSDRALTVMLINKQPVAATVTLQTANFASAGALQRWQLANNAITRVADTASPLTLPPASVTLIVIPGGANDLTEPSLAVTTATRGASGWHVGGTASDASGIARVTFRAYSDASVVSGTASGTGAWSIDLDPATTHVFITAWDAAGNPKTVLRHLTNGFPPKRRSL